MSFLRSPRIRDGCSKAEHVVIAFDSPSYLGRRELLSYPQIINVIGIDSLDSSVAELARVAGYNGQPARDRFRRKEGIRHVTVERFPRVGVFPP